MEASAENMGVGYGGVFASPTGVWEKMSYIFGSRNAHFGASFGPSDAHTIDE